MLWLAESLTRLNDVTSKMSAEWKPPNCIFLSKYQLFYKLWTSTNNQSLAHHCRKPTGIPRNPYCVAEMRWTWVNLWNRVKLSLAAKHSQLKSTCCHFARILLNDSRHSRLSLSKLHNNISFTLHVWVNNYHKRPLYWLTRSDKENWQMYSPKTTPRSSHSPHLSLYLLVQYKSGRNFLF